MKENLCQLFIQLGIQKIEQARCQWLMPIILPIWKAENRRIAVQGQPGQVLVETTFSK
jgi:hypothetical protein